MLTLGLVLLCAFSSAFLFVYGLTRAWWKSWEGRALIASSAGWAALSGGFLIDWYARDLPDWLWLAIAYLGVVAAVLKLWILIQSRWSKAE